MSTLKCPSTYRLYRSFLYMYLCHFYNNFNVSNSITPVNIRLIRSIFKTKPQYGVIAYCHVTTPGSDLYITWIGSYTSPKWTSLSIYTKRYQSPIKSQLIAAITAHNPPALHSHLYKDNWLQLLARWHSYDCPCESNLLRCSYLFSLHRQVQSPSIQGCT